jgi:uncharacterized protein YpmS
MDKRTFVHFLKKYGVCCWKMLLISLIAALIIGSLALFIYMVILAVESDWRWGIPSFILFIGLLGALAYISDNY